MYSSPSKAGKKTFFRILGSGRGVEGEGVVLAETRMDRGRTGETGEDPHEEGTDESGELAVEEMSDMSRLLWGVVGVGVDDEDRKRGLGRGEGALMGSVAGGGDGGGCRLKTRRLALFEATLCVVTASRDELPALSTVAGFEGSWAVGSND